MGSEALVAILDLHIEMGRGRMNLYIKKLVGEFWLRKDQLEEYFMGLN